MVSLLSTGFEDAVPPSGCTRFGTNQPASTQDLTVFHGGAASYLVDTSGGANTSALQKTFTATRMLVGRFYYRLATAPSGNNTIFTLVGPTNKAQFSVASATRALRGVIGGTVVTGPVLTVNQWYRIDFRIDTSGTTYTMDWQLDGVDQTQVTLGSQTAADITGVNWGCTSSQAAKGWFDDMDLSDTSGAYPLGALNDTATTHNPMGAMGFFGRQ